MWPRSPRRCDYDLLLPTFTSIFTQSNHIQSVPSSEAFIDSEWRGWVDFQYTLLGRCVVYELIWSNSVLLSCDNIKPNNSGFELPANRNWLSEGVLAWGNENKVKLLQLFGSKGYFLFQSNYKIVWIVILLYKLWYSPRKNFFHSVNAE